MNDALTSFKFVGYSVYDIHMDSEFRLGTYVFLEKFFSALTRFSSYYISFELNSPRLTAV